MKKPVYDSDYPSVSTSSADKIDRRLQSKSFKVKDLMKKKVICFKKETDVYDAIDILLSKGISGAPVVDEGNHIIGMCSQVDFFSLITNDSMYGHDGGTVGDIMNPNPKTVSPELDLYQLADIFLKNKVRRLPVVDDKGTVLGLVSRSDIIRAIKDMH